jgi:threonine dehydratase
MEEWMSGLEVQLAAIRAAHRRIAPHVHLTPVLTSSRLDAIAGSRLFFKCENFQKGGAFKARGAFNAVLSLSDEEAAKGVATHSSGNHAAALSLAARTRGVPAYIVMPSNTLQGKQDAVLAYGGQVTLCTPTLAAREAAAAEIVARTGARLIHPYDNDTVIAGQGTVALELIDQVGDLDMITCPVGGGGLVSGTALAVKGLGGDTVVIAAEPAGADDAWRSMAAGELLPQTESNTIADGLRTSLSPRTFQIMMDHVGGVLTTSEQAIIEAMRLIWQTMKIVVEPSAAVPLAALLESRNELPFRRIGVILTGGNVDLDRLPWTG